MRNSVEKRVPAVLLALCASAALGVTGAVAATGGFSSESEGDTENRANVVASVSAELAAQYAILRQPDTADDELKPFEGRAGMPPEYGENIALARRLGNSPYFVVPGENSVCLFDASGGGVCSNNPDRPTITTGGSCAAHRAGDYELLALFPDGPKSATVRFSDGRDPIEVPIEQNGISTRLPITTGDQTLTWENAGNLESARLAVVDAAMYCGE